MSVAERPDELSRVRPVIGETNSVPAAFVLYVMVPAEAVTAIVKMAIAMTNGSCKVLLLVIFKVSPGFGCRLQAALLGKAGG